MSNLFLMKNKYDTSVVFLYAIGKEHVLPEEFRKKIPYSTISTWRKTNYDQYLGHEFRYHFNEAFRSFELENENKRLKGAMMGLARSWITLSHTILPLIKNTNNNKEAQFKIITAINYLKALGFELRIPALSPLFLNEILRCTEGSIGNVFFMDIF